MRRRGARGRSSWRIPAGGSDATRVGWVWAGAAGGYLVSAGGRRLSLPELAGVAAVLALQALAEYDRALFVTRGRQRAAETIGVGMQWLIPFAVAAAARAGESLAVILPAHAAALALIVSARRRRGRRAAPGPVSADPRGGTLETAPAWAFAWPLMIAGCLAWLLHESDRLILGYYHGGAAVGLYAAAYGLVSAPFTTATGAVAQVMYPVVFAASARRGGSSVLSGPMFAGTLLIGVGGVSGRLVVGGRTGWRRSRRGLPRRCVRPVALDRRGLRLLRRRDLLRFGRVRGGENDAADGRGGRRGGGQRGARPAAGAGARRRGCRRRHRRWRCSCTWGAWRDCSPAPRGVGQPEPGSPPASRTIRGGLSWLDPGAAVTEP